MPHFRSIEGGFPDSDLQDLHTMVSMCSWVDPMKSIDESELAAFIENRLQDCGCEVWTMSVEGRRRNVIAEKGKGDTVIWMMGHMDTNEPEDTWSVKCSLQQSTDGDMLSGVGVWDMKIGLLQMLKLAREIDIPEGLKVIFIFLVDEEIDSKGVNAVLKYPQFPMPHFVGSPEIPTPARPSDLQGGKRHPIVVGRRGHAKFVGNVQVPSKHGGSRNVPQATEAYREVMNNLFKGFHGRAIIDPDTFIRRKREIMETVEEQTPDASASDRRRGFVKELSVYLMENQPRHPLFAEHQAGVEDLLEYEIHTVRKQSKYLTVPRRVEFELSHMFGPPMTVDDAILLQVALGEQITTQCQYNEKGIRLVLSASSDREQYEPYVMDQEKPFMLALAEAVDSKHSDRGASHVFAAGYSTSDMNKIAEAGLVGAETTGEGGNEHSDGEHASNRSAYRSFEVWKRFLTVEVPRVLHESSDGQGTHSNKDLFGGDVRN